jgi:hypothetical protein
MRLVANHTGSSERGKKPFKRLGMFDTSGVVKGEDSEYVTWFKADAKLLDELDNTILRCNEGHVHFHDLDDG